MTRRLCIPVLFLGLATGGCGAHLEPCTDGCPDISGVYAIENSTPVGECPFSPYLLGPTVQLLQTDNGRKAVLNVIDPSTQLEVSLTGEVFAPGPKDEPEVLGSFRLEARTVRSATRNNDRMVTLDVSATGSVALHEGRRVLSATLSTLEAASREGCAVTLAITGEGG